ncbi:hypothetical protein [Leucobacter sp. W1478]|uniref:hypothetical protein n=1 Tax=Leucobacter sp. W1478 TaxID=3439065 RepID=UPI003F2A8B56
MTVGVRRVIGRVVTSLVVLALVAGALVAYQNRQLISDHFAAQSFTPTAEIVDLTARIRPTSTGERIFFASEPTLDASQSFNERCSQVDHTEEGHVLGCFSGGRIHLFKVTDERLAGIVEVTAAHELLHAAFSRLNDAGKAELVQQLEAAFSELSATDPGLAERMDVYQGLSATAFANELHSVLGTEVRTLPAALETHYAQWFEQRSVIVDYFDDYHTVFTALKERASQLQAELTTMRADIELRSEIYDSAVAQFNSEWEIFLQRNEAFEFSDDPAEFYAIRNGFDTRRSILNEDLARLNADIATYEGLRVELQQLGELSTELEANLNSELAPPATAPTA